MYYNGLGAMFIQHPEALQVSDPELLARIRISASTAQQRPQKSEGWKTTRRCRYVYVCG